MDDRPSGWYDDPDDPSHLRYWDGSSWTERTHFKAPMPAPAPPKPPVTRLRPRRQEPGEDGTDGDDARGAAAAADGRPGHAVDSPQRREAAADGPHLVTATDSPRPWSQEPVSARRGMRGYRGAGGSGGADAASPTTQAAYWRRAVAYLLDLLVVSAVFFALLLVLLPLIPEVMQLHEAYARSILDAYQQQQPLPQPSPALTQVSSVLTLIFAGLLVLYDTVLLRTVGATVGGLALGTRVRDVDGGRAPAGRLFVRSLVKYSAFVLGFRPEIALIGYLLNVVDFLWPTATPRRLALHDMWSRTRVIRS